MCARFNRRNHPGKHFCWSSTGSLIHSSEIKFSLTYFCIYDFTEDWESASEGEHSDDSDESWIDVHHSSDEEADKTVNLLSILM